MHELKEILNPQLWLRRSAPFPHVVAHDVFTPAFYRALADQVGEVLARGLSETPAGARFSRSIPGYDAYAVGFGHSGRMKPTAVFMSPAWRDLMCGLFGITATPYVIVGAHHHSAGGKSGFIHNDLNPVWFPRAEGESIQLPDSALCDYQTGAGSLEAEQKVEVVRGAAAIFYLLNDGWQPGDGGETGLYSSRRDSVAAPSAAAPPINNSLLVFECTRRSFHAFVTNPGRPRTSIIMWVHRTKQEAAQRFGEGALERWKS